MASVIIPVQPAQGEWEIMIAEWADMYKLNDKERARLDSVLNDFEPTQIRYELREELRAVLAARKLSQLKPLTESQISKAKENSLASGRLEYLPND